jgi:hypothetical protein
MRGVDRSCGHHLDGADDDALLRLAREHIGPRPPWMERTDAQVREGVAADAFDVAALR